MHFRSLLRRFLGRQDQTPTTATQASSTSCQPFRPSINISRTSFLPTNAEASLKIQISNISLRMEEAFVNKGRPTMILPPETVPAILTKEELTTLFSSLLDQRSEVDKIVDDVRPPKDDAPHLYNILATLLYVKPSSEELKSFVTTWFNSSDPAQLHDANLPFDTDTATRLFGCALGGRFYEAQFIISPIILKEDEEHIFMDAPRAQLRLPIDDDYTTPIGEGHFAKVSMVKILRGGWIDKGNHVARGGETWLARKVFKNEEAAQGTGFDDAQQFGSDAFKAEMKIHEMTARTSETSKNLTYSLAGLSQPSHCSIFFRLASISLEQLLLMQPKHFKLVEQLKSRVSAPLMALQPEIRDMLLEHKPEVLSELFSRKTSQRQELFNLTPGVLDNVLHFPPTEWEAKAKILRDTSTVSRARLVKKHDGFTSTAPMLLDSQRMAQFIDMYAHVAYALYHLHSAKSRGKPQHILHGDVRPPNLLMFPETQKNERVVRLSVHDLGIARALRSSSEVVFFGSPEARCTYMAPEVTLHKKETFMSDLWSFGCILLDQITWLVGGPDMVEEFRRLRVHTADGSEFDDFWIKVQGSPVLHPEIPKWCRRLVHRARATNHVLGRILQDLLNYLIEHVLVVDDDERNAKAADGRWIGDELEVFAHRLAGRPSQPSQTSKPSKPSKPLRHKISPVSEMISTSSQHPTTKSGAAVHGTRQQAASQRHEHVSHSHKWQITAKASIPPTVEMRSLDGQKLANVAFLNTTSSCLIKSEQSPDGNFVFLVVQNNGFKDVSKTLLYCRTDDLYAMSLDSRSNSLQRVDSPHNHAKVQKLASYNGAVVLNHGHALVYHRDKTNILAATFYRFGAGNSGRNAEDIFKVEVAKATKNGIGRDHQRIISFLPVFKDGIAYLALSVQSALVSIHMNGKVKVFDAGLNILQILPSPRARHPIVLASTTHGKSSEICVWKANLRRKTIHKLGVFKGSGRAAVENDDSWDFSSAEIERGGFMRRHKITIETKGMNQLVGRFK